MSEISELDITCEFEAEVIATNPYENLIWRSEIANMLNIAQRHGFTVLKPGEIHWLQIGEEIAHGLGSVREYRIYFNPQLGGWIGYENKVTTLEAAKAYCQQLENQALKQSV